MAKYLIGLILGLTILSSSPSIAFTKEDVKCLALNDYHEARSETTVGRIAVAYVVINRSRDGYWPRSICGVIYQQKSGVCQFSWTCRGYVQEIKDRLAWGNSIKLAKAMLDPEQRIKDPSKGALYYHTLQRNPRWRLNLKPVMATGNHLFYKDK